MISEAEASALLPNTMRYAMIWRPIMADPPLYSLGDVRKLTICDVLDANEQLDFRVEIARRAQRRAESGRKGA